MILIKNNISFTKYTSQQTLFWQGYSNHVNLLDVNASSFPIEPLGYTETEFEAMLMAFRLTALDAVSEGKPLYGEDHFNTLKNKLNDLEKTGLYKGRTSWHIPDAATA